MIKQRHLDQHKAVVASLLASMFVENDESDQNAKAARVASKLYNYSNNKLIKTAREFIPTYKGKVDVVGFSYQVDLLEQHTQPEFGADCTKCKTNYPMAETVDNFTCWSCRNNW